MAPWTDESDFWKLVNEHEDLKTEFKKLQEEYQKTISRIYRWINVCILLVVIGIVCHWF